MIDGEIIDIDTIINNNNKNKYEEIKLLSKTIHGNISLVKYNDGILRVIKRFNKLSLKNSRLKLEGINFFY